MGFSFGLLYERYFVETCFDDPEALSYLGLLETTGIRGHNRTLSNSPSETSSARRVAFARADLGLLAAMEARGNGAPVEEAVSVGVLRWMLTNDVTAERFMHHAYALDQMDGIHVTLIMWLTDITPVRARRVRPGVSTFCNDPLTRPFRHGQVRCLEDGWNYVARLGCFGDRFALVGVPLPCSACFLVHNCVYVFA